MHIRDYNKFPPKFKIGDFVYSYYHPYKYLQFKIIDFLASEESYKNLYETNFTYHDEYLIEGFVDSKVSLWKFSTELLTEEEYEKKKEEKSE